MHINKCGVKQQIHLLYVYIVKPNTYNVCLVNSPSEFIFFLYQTKCHISILDNERILLIPVFFHSAWSNIISLAIKRLISDCSMIFLPLDLQTSMLALFRRITGTIESGPDLWDRAFHWNWTCYFINLKGGNLKGEGNLPSGSNSNFSKSKSLVLVWKAITGSWENYGTRNTKLKFYVFSHVCFSSLA